MVEFNENGTPKGVPGARGKKKLTPEQEDAMKYGLEADNRWRMAKLNARTEAKRIVEERIAMHAAVRDKAVYDAVKLGIPKGRITTEMLRTGPNAIYEIIDRVEKNVEATEVEVLVPELPKCHWGSHHRFGSDNNVYWLEVDGNDIVQDVRHLAPNWPVYPGYMYQKIGDKPWMWTGEKPDEATQKWAEEHPPA